MRSRCWVGVTGLLLGAAVSTGCLRAQARATPAFVPELAVPLPPPRLVEPVVSAVPQPVGLAGEPPQSTEMPRPPAAATRTETAKPDALKVDPVAADQPRPSEGLRPQTQTTLQTTPVEQEADVSRKIKDLLSKAAADLSRVDYNRLSADARTQYDQAKRFGDQADEALQQRNLVFAGFLADKAATLAAQLAGR